MHDVPPEHKNFWSQKDKTRLILQQRSNDNSILTIPNQNGHNSSWLSKQELSNRLSPGRNPKSNLPKSLSKDARTRRCNLHHHSSKSIYAQESLPKDAPSQTHQQKTSIAHHPPDQNLSYFNGHKLLERSDNRATNAGSTEFKRKLIQKFWTSNKGEARQVTNPLIDKLLTVQQQGEQRLVESLAHKTFQSLSHKFKSVTNLIQDFPAIKQIISDRLGADLAFSRFLENFEL